MVSGGLMHRKRNYTSPFFRNIFFKGVEGVINVINMLIFYFFRSQFSNIRRPNQLYTYSITPALFSIDVDNVQEPSKHSWIQVGLYNYLKIKKQNYVWPSVSPSVCVFVDSVYSYIQVGLYNYLKLTKRLRPIIAKLYEY